MPIEIKSTPSDIGGYNFPCRSAILNFVASEEIFLDRNNEGDSLLGMLKLRVVIAANDIMMKAICRIIEN